MAIYKWQQKKQLGRKFGRKFLSATRSFLHTSMYKFLKKKNLL